MVERLTVRLFFSCVKRDFFLFCGGLVAGVRFSVRACTLCVKCLDGLKDKRVWVLGGCRWGRREAGGRRAVWRGGVGRQAGRDFGPHSGLAFGEVRSRPAAGRTRNPVPFNTVASTSPEIPSRSCGRQHVARNPVPFNAASGTRLGEGGVQRSGRRVEGMGCSMWWPARGANGGVFEGASSPVALRRRGLEPVWRCGN
jgi:hypothetical protein